MRLDMKTLELAKVYENQGYFEDAREIYLFLDKQDTTDEIRAGLDRLDNQISAKGQDSNKPATISRLFEKWLRLMVLKQRLS